MPDDQNRAIAVDGVDGSRAPRPQRPYVGWVFGWGARRRGIRVGRRVRDARLLTAADLEAQRESSGQVVAGVVVALREIAEITAGQGHDDGSVGAGVRDHQMTSRPQYAGELCQHRAQVEDMVEGEGADYDVDVVVRHGQMVQVTFVELGVRQFRLRYCQHLRGAVHADHVVAEGSQVLGVAAGAAGRVKYRAARQAIEDLPDHRLLTVDEPIARLVISWGPGAIALRGSDRAGPRSFPELVC